MNLQKCYNGFKTARRQAVDDTISFFNGSSSERKDIRIVLKTISDNIEYFSRKSLSIENSEPKSELLPVLRSGIEPVNFIYGEVEFFEFYKILMTAFENEKSGLKRGFTFLDLGCGAGACMAAAAAVHIPGESFLVSNLIGIELMEAKLYECCSLLTHFIPMLQSEDFKLGASKVGNIKLFECNFLATELNWIWAESNVIYACATCFSDLQMNSLLSRLLSTHIGTILILMDKEIRSTGGQCSERSEQQKVNYKEESTAEGDLRFSYTCMSTIQRIGSDGRIETIMVDAFELMDSICCKTSWGEGYAHIYRKVI